MPWAPSEKDEVVKALAVACEVTGTTLTDAGRMFMLSELERHPAFSVVKAIKEAARECKSRIRLADIVGGINRVDRKALSDARSTQSHYETTLRGLALIERIPWESGVDEVRRLLVSRGYSKLPAAPSPEEKAMVRNLPHWQDDTERE